MLLVDSNKHNGVRAALLGQLARVKTVEHYVYNVLKFLVSLGVDFNVNASAVVYHLSEIDIRNDGKRKRDDNY